MSTTNPYDAPHPSGESLPFASSTESLVIKSIDVLSAATMIGALYAVIGLIAGAIISIVSLIALLGGGGNTAGALIGLGAIVLAPLGYGVMGFVAGAIGAFVYNLVSQLVGGLRLQISR